MSSYVGVNEARLFQTLLHNIGKTIVIDGDWGPASTRALKEYQKSVGATPTGLPNPQTYDLLTVSYAIRPEEQSLLSDKSDKLISTLFNVGKNRLPFVKAVIGELDKNKEKYFLNDPLRERHLLAQVGREVGRRFRIEESFAYSPRGLKINFKYFRIHEEEAYMFGYNYKIGKKADSEAIANRAYANRMGNGTIASGDGYHTRGRGIKQLTGTDNLNAFTKWNKKVFGENIDFLKTPEIIVEDPVYAARSGAFFWVDNSLYLIADQGSSDNVVNRITKVVNPYDGKGGKRVRRKNFRILSLI